VEHRPAALPTSTAALSDVRFCTVPRDAQTVALISLSTLCPSGPLQYIAVPVPFEPEFRPSLSNTMERASDLSKRHL
jgi:hypothetical protein